MDNPAHLILATDLKAQLETLKRIVKRLDKRAEGLTPEDVVRMESVAYQIHNFYNAVEELLKVIATHFENNISDSIQWHSALLKRMTQDIPGIRPAVFSIETFTTLNGLRGFHHFFRHAYEVPINYEQLMVNFNLVGSVLPELEQDIETFIAKLQAYTL